MELILNIILLLSSKNEKSSSRIIYNRRRGCHIYNDSDWFEPPVYLFKKKRFNLTKNIIKKKNGVLSRKII